MADTTRVVKILKNNRVHDDCWLFYCFSIGNIKLGREVKIRITALKPHSEPDGVLFVVEVNIMNADDAHTSAHGIGRFHVKAVGRYLGRCRG